MVWAAISAAFHPARKSTPAGAETALRPLGLPVCASFVRFPPAGDFWQRAPRLLFGAGKLTASPASGSASPRSPARSSTLKALFEPQPLAAAGRARVGAWQSPRRMASGAAGASSSLRHLASPLTGKHRCRQHGPGGNGLHGPAQATPTRRPAPPPRCRRPLTCRAQAQRQRSHLFTTPARQHGAPCAPDSVQCAPPAWVSVPACHGRRRCRGCLALFLGAPVWLTALAVACCARCLLPVPYHH